MITLTINTNKYNSDTLSVQTITLMDNIKTVLQNGNIDDESFSILAASYLEYCDWMGVEDRDKIADMIRLAKERGVLVVNNNSVKIV